MEHDSDNSSDHASERNPWVDLVDNSESLTDDQKNFTKFNTQCAECGFRLMSRYPSACLSWTCPVCGQVCCGEESCWVRHFDAKHTEARAATMEQPPHMRVR